MVNTSRSGGHGGISDSECTWVPCVYAESWELLCRCNWHAARLAQYQRSTTSLSGSRRLASAALSFQRSLDLKCSVMQTIPPHVLRKHVNSKPLCLDESLGPSHALQRRRRRSSFRSRMGTCAPGRSARSLVPPSVCLHNCRKVELDPRQGLAKSICCRTCARDLPRSGVQARSVPPSHVLELLATSKRKHWISLDHGHKGGLTNSSLLLQVTDVPVDEG